MPTPTTILVVEDFAPISRLLQMVLEDQGDYIVLEEANGASAIDVLRRTHPASMVVLFDYLLPDMDGAAFLALVEREHWLSDRLACICMTGMRRQDLPATFEALLTRYGIPLLMKPFALEDVLAAVQQAEQRLAQFPASSSAPPYAPPYAPPPRRLDRAAGED